MEKIKECPAGLLEAREHAVAFVKDLKSKAPPNARLLIGGFSQGGVMATDVALSLPPEDRVFLAAFSPFLVDVNYWKERVKLHGSNLEALVTHGKTDPIIPYMAGEMLTSILKEGGGNVKFANHMGGHTLGDDRVIKTVKDFFAQVLTK